MPNPQRSVTGKLARALSLGHPLAMTDPEPWSSGRSYEPGNLVATSGGRWVCAMPTSPGQAPGESDRWWLIVGPPSTYGTGSDPTTVGPLSVGLIGTGFEDEGNTLVVLLSDGTTATVAADTLPEGLVALVMSAPSSMYEVVGGVLEIRESESSLDGLWSAFGFDDVNGSNGTVVNVVDGYAYPIDLGPDEVHQAPSFSYTFTVPEEDYYDDETGFKVTHNQPYNGMLTINLYDLGVHGDPDKRARPHHVLACLGRV